MGIGLISISTTQKKEQPGPPFASNSADNGLSVDSTSGRIVLGNDAGDATNPAALLSDREIQTGEPVAGTFGITLLDNNNNTSTRLDGQFITQGATDSTSIGLLQNIPDGGTVLNAATGVADGIISNSTSLNSGLVTWSDRVNTDIHRMQMFGLGSVDYAVSIGITYHSVNTSTGAQEVGQPVTGFNGATFQVTGTCTYRHFVASFGAAGHAVDRNLDSSKLFINSGAATFTLPNMAASNLRLGFIARFCVINSAGITVQAEAGQIIRFGSLVTSTGGTISSTDVGAYMTIVLVNSTTWVTESFNGAWVLT